VSDFIQVVTTLPSALEAERLARALVEQHLAACAQVIGPVRSVYRWQERIETAEEWQCQIKTRRTLFPAIQQAIGAVHPYEVPEILATPVETGNRQYLEWVRHETERRPEGSEESDGTEK
jgi:periplasmic divalent cation tolerance protein